MYYYLPAAYCISYYTIQMSREPKSPKGISGLIKITVNLDAQDVREIDRIAEEQSQKDPYHRQVKRSDIVRMLIKSALYDKKK